MSSGVVFPNSQILTPDPKTKERVRRDFILQIQFVIDDGGVDALTLLKNTYSKIDVGVLPSDIEKVFSANTRDADLYNALSSLYISRFSRFDASDSPAVRKLEF